MKVIANNDVLEFLRDYELKNKKVARIKLADACCGMIEPEVVFDVQRDDDVCYEIDGVKFLIKKEYDFLINIVRLERTAFGVDIQRDFI